VTIGRAGECDLVVNDSFLSRSHVRVYTEGESLMVEDLGSANGTLLNGSKISQATEVTHGDVLLISGTHVSITHAVDLSDPSSAPTEAPAGVTVLRPLSELLPQGPEQEAAAREDDDALGRYADRLKLLNEVHRALGMSAELDELLELVLDGAFEHLGPEQAIILLVDEDGELLPAAARPPLDEDSSPISQTLVHEVVEKGQAAVAVDIASDDRFAGAQSIIASGARSLLAAPLLDSEGCGVGMIALSSSLHKKIFSEEDLELLASLASVAALRIRNISLAKSAAERDWLEREVALARRVQESLLPKQLPELDGFEIDASNIPSRGVSGDFYQVMERGEGEDHEVIAIVVDVSGKGMAASLLSVGLDTAISVLVEAGTENADEILGEANNLLYRKTPPDKFATAVMVILKPATGQVQWVNAGHNPPLLIRASGEVVELEATGFPLAMLPDGDYTAEEFTLEPGDLLAIFTDGIVEAENPDDEEFQLDRMVEAMMTAIRGDIVGIRESLESELDRFVDGVPYRDDRTLVLLRRT